MHGLVLNLVLALTAAGPEERTYEQAFTRSQKDDRPLLVLVGADWCPACRSMKQVTLPRMEKAGKFKAVEFAQVDIDREPQLGRKLMRGATVPQLILFTRQEGGWSRAQLTGGQSERDIETFVRTSVANHVARSTSPNSAPMARQASSESDVGGAE